jgi:two-component system, NarL family, nitrate/nitrite response regulator NarL
MRLLVADDHELIRDTLQSFLAREAEVEIVTVGDLPAAYNQIAQDMPFDLVLLDYAMPGMNGLEGLARVLALPNPPKVALLSGLAARDVAEAALAMGAQGFLTKSMPARSLLSAIRFMATGERFVPVEVMLSGLPGPDPMPLPQAEGGGAVSLTPRELQVLRALCDGKTNKEIARDMGLREPTVKLHIKTLYRRLGASNRTQAAMMARRLGLV